MNPDTYYCEACDEWRETVELAPSTARRCLECSSLVLCGVCGATWTDWHADVCEGADADTRGYVVEVRTTRVEVHYVRGRGNAEDAAYNAQCGGWRPDTDIRATVTRCEHMSGYAERVPVTPNGLTTYLRWTCDDCGEHYRTDIEHAAVYVSRHPFNPETEPRYYTDTWRDAGEYTDDIARLAHV